jgi:signal transduction histidine kinase
MPTLDETGKEYLQQLDVRVRRMHKLVGGILRYSQLHNEGTTSVDLERLKDEILTLVAAPEHIAITFHDPLPTVMGHETNLIQVFQNLLGNAVKYMDKSQGRIDVSILEEESTWRFRISDNGPGIDKSYHESIFQMFETIGPKDNEDRTGIGLAIVRRVVELHGGKVWVESEIGQGTEFYFTLPKGTAATIETADKSRETELAAAMAEG